MNFRSDLVRQFIGLLINVQSGLDRKVAPAGSVIINDDSKSYVNSYRASVLYLVKVVYPTSSKSGHPEPEKNRELLSVPGLVPYLKVNPVFELTLEKDRWVLTSDGLGSSTLICFSYIYNNSGTSFATHPDKDRIARPVLSLHINSWYSLGPLTG